MNERIARDKGRARATIIGIFGTVLFSLIIVLLAKAHKKANKSSFAEDLIHHHAEYSKTHQEAIKSTYK